MSRNMRSFLDSVQSFFTGGDNLPWTDADIIVTCESEAAGEGTGLSKDSDMSDSIMRLSWALVHSRHSSDVQRGIAMLEEHGWRLLFNILESHSSSFSIYFVEVKGLEAALGNDSGPLQKREILYLLGVGHYRAEDYARSRRYIDQALQIAPDFRQALTLKKIVEDKIAKDGVIGIGIAIAAAGVVAGGLAAALSRKN